MVSSQKELQIARQEEKLRKEIAEFLGTVPGLEEEHIDTMQKYAERKEFKKLKHFKKHLKSPEFHNEENIVHENEQKNKFIKIIVKDKFNITTPDKEKGMHKPLRYVDNHINQLSSEKPLGRWFIIFAIALWAADGLWIGFSGIKYVFINTIFRNPTSLEYLTRILWNSFTLIILGILIWNFAFNEPRKKDLIALAIMLEIVNVIITLGGWHLGLILHLLFALGFLFFELIPYYGEGKHKAYIYTAIFLIIDFFVFPYLKYNYIGDSITKGAFPIWVFITLYYALKGKKSLLLSLFGFGLLMIYLFAFGKPLIDDQFAGQAGLESEKLGFKGIREVGEKALTNIKGGFKNVKESYDKSFSYATGDYYTGKVDQNVEEPLGVYITDIETLDLEVYEDEPIEIWATLKAKSIEEPIDLIKINCTADIGVENEQKDGKVKVKEFRNFIDEEEDIDCKFEEGELDKGSHLITFGAEFDFTTLAYLKTYFIDNERLKALKREDIDVFKEYGIRDTNPISISTNGPVSINMETKTPPIGISKEYDSTPKLGITIDNRWQGIIQEIKDLYIYLPEGIELEDNCDDAFERVESVKDEYISEDYNIYKLVNRVKVEKKWRKIPDYRSKNCRLWIKEEDVKKVLGDTPISVKYIKAKIEYIYSSQESINVNVEAPKGFNVYFDPKRPSLNSINTESIKKDYDKLKCVASHSDLDVIRARFYIYKWENDDWKEIVDGLKIECEGKKQSCDYSVASILENQDLKRGNRIKCKVDKAKLSNNEEETDTAIVKIRNSAPIITNVKLNPENPNVDHDNLKFIFEIKDYDGDVAIPICEVKVKDEKIASNVNCEGNKCTCSVSIEGKNLKEGDIIYYKISARDLPPSEFEFKESEIFEDSITIGKSTEESSSGTEGSSGSTTFASSDDCLHCDADCSDSAYDGKACGKSYNMICYDLKCISECRHYAITQSNYEWYCKSEGWDFDKCMSTGNCQLDMCKDGIYCVKEGTEVPT